MLLYCLLGFAPPVQETTHSDYARLEDVLQTSDAQRPTKLCKRLTQFPNVLWESSDELTFKMHQIVCKRPRLASSITDPAPLQTIYESGRHTFAEFWDFGIQSIQHFFDPYVNVPPVVSPTECRKLVGLKDDISNLQLWTTNITLARHVADEYKHVMRVVCQDYHIDSSKKWAAYLNEFANTPFLITDETYKTRINASPSPDAS